MRCSSYLGTAARGLTAAILVAGTIGTGAGASGAIAGATNGTAATASKGISTAGDGVGAATGATGGAEGNSVVSLLPSAGAALERFVAFARRR